MSQNDLEKALERLYVMESNLVNTMKNLERFRLRLTFTRSDANDGDHLDA